MAEKRQSSWKLTTRPYGCTKRPNLEMEPNYRTENKVQLNANISKMKKNKKIMSKAQ